MASRASILANRPGRRPDRGNGLGQRRQPPLPRADRRVEVVLALAPCRDGRRARPRRACPARTRQPDRRCPPCLVHVPRQSLSCARLRRSQVLMVGTGRAVALGQLLAAQALAVGQQHHVALVGLQAVEAAGQPLHVLALVQVVQRARLVAGDLQRLGRILDRHRIFAAHLVEGPVAGDRRHPGDRRCPWPRRSPPPAPRCECKPLAGRRRRGPACARYAQRHRRVSPRWRRTGRKTRPCPCLPRGAAGPTRRWRWSWLVVARRFPRFLVRQIRTRTGIGSTLRWPFWPSFGDLSLAPLCGVRGNKALPPDARLPLTLTLSPQEVGEGCAYV